MLREIGSNFWLLPEDVENSNKDNPESLSAWQGAVDSVWLSTCRSAIKLLLSQCGVESRVALVPAYTCETVIAPFVERGYQLEYYEVNQELMTPGREIIRLLEKTGASLFLFHHYFGFKTISDIGSVIEYAKTHDIVTVEDCTQSMYSDFDKSSSDYEVGSIRKWCGVPDGAYLMSRRRQVQGKPVYYDCELEEAMKEAELAKYHYMVNGEGKKEHFLDLYRKAKQTLDHQTKAYAISPLSLSLQMNLDKDHLKRQRRANFSHLLSRSSWSRSIYPIFRDIPEGVVPLYFPVWVANRSGLQSHLAAHAIYSPIIWPKPSVCPHFGISTESLYDHMLCIPIDQRYGLEEMEYIVQNINDYEC